MAVATAARSIFLLQLPFILSSLYSGTVAELKVVNADCQQKWCIAKPSSSAQELKNNIDYACSHVDCAIIQPGFPCFAPDNLSSHASIAMNLYYKANGCNTWNCDFKNSALVTITNPSYGRCAYA